MIKVPSKLLGLVYQGGMIAVLALFTLGPWNVDHKDCYVVDTLNQAFDKKPEENGLMQTDFTYWLWVLLLSCLVI